MKINPKICATRAGIPTTKDNPRAFPMTIVSRLIGFARRIFMVLACLSLWNASTETPIAANETTKNTKKHNC